MSTPSSPATRTWTPAQRDAIEAVGVNVLVSAAAGSGKTSVLAERCAHLVCTAPPPHRCDVTELLVVTFTRAAAAEMRSRSEQALRGRAGEGDRRLRRQAELVARAEIGTLHGFCARVLRRHFAAAGVDPAFSTLDEHEALLLRNEVARRLFERRFAGDATPGSADAFAALVARYGDGDDAALRRVVVRVHEMLCSIVDPGAWCAQAVARLEEASAADPIEQTALGVALMAATRQFLGGLAIDAQAACRAAQRDFPRYLDHATALAEVVSSWVDAASGEGGWDQLAKQIKAYTRPKVPTVKLADLSSADALAKERVKKQIDRLKERMCKKGWLVEACRFTASEWRNGCRDGAAPAARTLLDVVRAFSDDYAAAKQQFRALDFADLERLTLRALCDPASGPGECVPGAAARGYHEQFKHVLVDEYQDVNAMQDRILRLVSHECLPPEALESAGMRPNLFCVGDVKQSIYRFRLADPSQFLSRADRYRRDPSAGRVIDLSENFRSDPGVIDAVNLTFERLMTAEAAEVQYDHSHRLRTGKPAGAYRPVDDAVELLVLPPVRAPDPSAPTEPDDTDSDDDDRSTPKNGGESPADEFDRTEREAAVVAGLIRRAVDEGLSAGGGVERFAYRDVAVLLRSMKHKAEQFASVLRRADIPVIADSASGFFEAAEVRDMLALLRCIDNPLQDLPLATLLRSPLSRFGPDADDAMARVRLAYPDRRAVPFCRAVFAYATDRRDELASRLAGFAGWLNDLRGAARFRPVAAVIGRALHETGYLAWCSALHDGPQRVANLLFLHDQARQFGQFNRRGVRRFLDFLLALEAEGDLGLPSAPADPGDVVRVMSVHRSKGLEFPVVLLPDLGKLINTRDATASLLVDRDVFVAPQVVDETRRARWPSLPWMVASRHTRQRVMAEELRVLYVAMTRAKRKLFAIGSVAKGSPEEQAENWRNRWSGWDGPLPPETIRAARHALEWIGPAQAAVAELPGAMRLRPLGPQDVDAAVEALKKRAGDSAARDRLAGVVALRPLRPEPQTTPLADAVRADLGWRSPWGGYACVPAARAVTAVTKSGRRAAGGESESAAAAVVQFEPPLVLPRFVEPARAVAPTERGNATHRILRVMRLTTDPAPDGVRREIERLATGRYITPDDARIADAEAIAWFLATPLATALRSPAARVWRELPVFAATAATLPPGAPPLELPPSADGLDREMLRGQVDLLARLPPEGPGPEAGRLVVIDYKTDRVTPQTIASRVEFYRPQLGAYCAAVGRIAREPVAGAYLVFLTAREVVRL